MDGHWDSVHADGDGAGDNPLLPYTTSGISGLIRSTFIILFMPLAGSVNYSIYIPGKVKVDIFITKASSIQL